MLLAKFACDASKLVLRDCVEQDLESNDSTKMDDMKARIAKAACCKLDKENAKKEQEEKKAKLEKEKTEKEDAKSKLNKENDVAGIKGDRIGKEIDELSGKIAKLGEEYAPRLKEAFCK